MVSSVSLACLWLGVPGAFAADEICASCGQQVSLSGDFAHRKDNASVAIEGASDAAAFREEINGTNFTVSIMHLPAGKYTIVIGETETLAGAAGERLFDVTCGEVALAMSFDIFATAGGARKACSITGAVQHEDDSIKGPLAVLFAANKGVAKFNTFEIKNSSGASVVAFSASELADAFSAAAVRVPEVKEPPIWRDPSEPLKARADDLIRRMSLAEKVGQLQGGMSGAPGIPRLGLPAYNYWNEALHGVANNGIATVFPEPVSMASTCNPELLHQAGHVVGIEGRAKFNDYASKHNGDSKWWTGLTFWTPNINIFRDPRWGRGQETYGEDPYLTGAIGVEFVKGLQGDDPDLHAGHGLRQALRGPQRAGSNPPLASMRGRRIAICLRPTCRSLSGRCAKGTSPASWAPTARSMACLTARILSCSPTCCASSGDLKVMSFRIATPSATSGGRSSIIM